MMEARRGLEVAIELVGRETEERLGAAMDVLEAVGGRGMEVKTKEKPNRVAKRVGGAGGGSLNGEEEGEVLVAADRGFL